MTSLRAVSLMIFGLALAACDGETASGTTTTTGSTGSGGDGGGGGAGAKYALHVKIELFDDGQGVNLFTQNGSMVHVPKADIVGKTYYWLTTPGGEPAGNGKTIDLGVSDKIKDDLTAEFSTAKNYPDGPFEMSLVVSVTGANPTMGPQAGDLAAFDLTKPPAGDPPVTGTSVRMKVQGADASLKLTNTYFIRF